MRLFFVISLCILSKIVFAQFAFNDSLIKKHKISKLTIEFSDGLIHSIWTHLYDKEGRRVSTINEDWPPGLKYTRTVEKYTYGNSNLIQNWITYEKGKIVDSGSSVYFISPKSKEKQISESISFYEGTISKQHYVYNGDKIDTLYFYKGVVSQDTQKLTLSSYEAHQYDSDGFLKKKVRWSKPYYGNSATFIDSSGYSITDYSKNGDTLIKTYTQYLRGLPKKITIKKILETPKYTLLIDEYGDESKTIKEKNHVGLPTNTIIYYNRKKGKKSKTVFSYKYKYYPSK